MINEFTPDYKSELEAYTQKWCNFSRTTGATNRSEAENGIRLAYINAELTLPSKIVWYDSPVEMFSTPYIVRHLDSEVATCIFESTIDLKQQVYSTVHGSVLHDMFQMVTNIVQPIYFTRDVIQLALLDYIRINTSYAAAEVANVLSHYSFDGQHSPRSFITFDYLLNHDQAGFNYDLSVYAETIVAQHAGLWIPFQDICFVSERYTTIHYDERNRPHCADGLAIEYPDGWGVYAWHGVRVPDYVIQRPSMITSEKILSERNTEVARIMLERYGQDNFIRDGGFSKVQSDDYGDLYRVEFENGDEPIVAVHVKDASTDRDYFLYVPPHIRTAHQGVAWTFGYDNVDDYNPDKET